MPMKWNILKPAVKPLSTGQKQISWRGTYWDVNGSFLQFLNPINWFTAEKRWDRVFQRVRCGDAPS